MTFITAGLPKVRKTISGSCSKQGAENALKILIPVDFSSTSQAAVTEILHRNWPATAAFLVINVVDLTGLGHFAVLADQEKARAQTLVSSVAQRFKEAGLGATTDVLFGFPRRDIVRYANEWRPDLIMLGTHGHGVLARLLIGSIAHAALRTASCSVEIVRPRGSVSRNAGASMKILLATDGSEGAAAAAKSVAAGSWPNNSEVKIVSVVELVMPGMEMGAASSAGIYPASLLDELWNEARVRAREAVRTSREIAENARLKVPDGLDTPEGDPRFVLVEYARKWRADLVVLGSHGRRGLDRMLMGSVSESVALHAPCSVEVVREPHA